jgi:hypothetical protein
MSFEIHTVSIRDFLRTDVSGVIDFEASKAILTEIVLSCRERSISRVLMDAREAVPLDIGASDIYSLVMHLISLGFGRGHRIAVLDAPKDEIDRAKLFEQCAHEQGLNIASFREFEGALAWLSGTRR